MNMADSLENHRTVADFLSSAQGLGHVSIPAKNFIVNDHLYLAHIDDVIETTLANGKTVFMDVPAGVWHDDLNNIVLDKYNTFRVNTHKVYPIDSHTVRAQQFALSMDIKSSRRNIGVMLQLHHSCADDDEAATKFVEACSTAFANAADKKKHIEVTIQCHNENVMHKVRSSMEFWGQEVFQKIRIVDTPFFEVRGAGLDTLHPMPYDEDWLSWVVALATH